MTTKKSEKYKIYLIKKFAEKATKDELLEAIQILEEKIKEMNNK